ncbi:ABC transporter permease, partial [Bacillus horti]
MSPWTIVYQRWKRHLKHQIKLFSSIVDGVVALYIFIPALLILGYHLIELWQGSATWPTYLSFSGIIILLYIWSLTGRFSFFVEGADRIILRQHEGLMKGLQRYAVSFSAVHSLLSCILLFIVLAPVLLQYFKLSALGMLLLFGLSLAVKLLHHSLKSYFILPFRTWRKWSLALVILLLDFSLFLGAGLLTRSVATEHTASWVTSSFNFPIPYTPVLVILIMGYMITATLLMLRRTSIPWAFTFDCLQEEEQKYRAIGFLIKQSQNIGGPDLSRNKPWKKSSLLYFLLPSRK